MRTPRPAALSLAALLLSCLLAGCSGKGEQKPFVAVLESPPRTLDQLSGNDASSERIRQLVYNSLVRKNEKLDYVG